MKSLLLRNGSLPKSSPAFPSSPKFSISRRDSISGVFSGERNAPVSLNLRRKTTTPIGRTRSENDIAGSETEVLKNIVTATSRSFPARIPEEEYVFGEDQMDRDCGGWKLSGSGLWPEKDVGFGTGGGDGGDRGKRNDSGGNGDGRKRMGEYYEEMLKLNPGDSLLLRNYGRFLEEVEGDKERAEEYYGRAILANPGDGEVLSLYGRLIWDMHRDEERAQSYFHQAVSASPNDCMVMGSYARFMWEAAEDEDEEINGQTQVLSSAAMVAVL
ncbi:Tetratricopeptide repeat (TPR)-like superfamily protein [Euphorbia peplus]|nr:Tetratricopeptide repeat (TPR)-like superfamily protein [Euphorbia peplus]